MKKLYNALKGGPLGNCILWVEDDLDLPAVGEPEDFVINVDGLSPYSADEIE